MSGASRRTGFGGVDLGRSSLDGARPVDQRRTIFFSLVVGAVSSLLFGLVLSMSLLVEMSLLMDVALAGYVVYLVRTKRTGRARPSFDQVDPQPEEEHWLRAGEM